MGKEEGTGRIELYCGKFFDRIIRECQEFPGHSGPHRWTDGRATIEWTGLTPLPLPPDPGIEIPLRKQAP